MQEAQAKLRREKDAIDLLNRCSHDNYPFSKEVFLGFHLLRGLSGIADCLLALAFCQSHDSPKKHKTKIGIL
jgi:hypothetical protein